MVTFGFKKRKALAQIPVLLGLLIMALVVPAATKLVQENQDTRNRAASVISPPPSGCTDGYVRCFNNIQQRCQNGSWVFQKNCPNGCSGNYCKVVVPTNTPKPPTSTPKPLSYICSSLGGSCVSYGCTCGTITGGTCQGEDECCRPCPTSTPKPPTLTPTRAPSPTPTTACTGTCQYSDCLTMNMKTGTGNCPQPQYCCGEKIIAPICNLGDKHCADDNLGVWVCKTDKSGYTLINCSVGKKCNSVTETCVSISTPTPTKIPTSTPTRAPTATPTTACSGTCQYSDCLTMNMKTGVGSCPRPQYCCGEKIISYACKIGERECLPDKSGVNICKGDRTGYTIFKCSEGRVCDSVSKTCVALPTVTPVTSCLPDGRMTESGDKCCSKNAIYAGSSLICSCLPDSRTTDSASKCCSKEAVYQGSSLVCKAISTSILKQPGDSCSKDEDCASGKCKATTLGLFNKKCISLKVSGDTCSNNSDCTSGICDEKICKEVGEAGFVCKPGEFKCSDSKTLLTCTETGSGWIKQACSSCVNNVCNGLDSYPVCSGGLEGSDYDCPTNWACTGAKVPDKIGLWYCEPKSAVNANPICTPGALRCNGSNSQASLETCSPDGRRWLSTLTCPLPLSMAGYNYSCKQITSLEAQCRPPTEQEMKEFAIEFVVMNAAAVAMPFTIGGAATTLLPAAVANLPTIMSVVRIGNAVYAVNNAAKECQGFEGMTNDEKMKCVLAAGYAVTATVDGGLAGTGLVTKGSALLSGIEVVNDVANLTLGGVNAYNQCEGGTDKDCYYALISSGIDLVALGVDINQAKQWSKANLKIEVETLLDTSMTNLTPGRPIVNVSQITGSKIGGGSFGSTYLDKNSNVLTKIFFDPDLPGNASQISFYQQYGNAPLVQGYMGDVVDESGKVIGFQQKYIPNTVSLGEYLSRGGTFTQGSVDEVVNNLALNQSITGQAHGDLVRPDNILNWQGDRGWPGYIHPGNVLVEILPDGSPKIHIIDWNGYNTFTEPLSSPDVMQLELETIKNGLQQFVP